MNNLYQHITTLTKDTNKLLVAFICILSISTVNAQVATYNFENPSSQDGSQDTNAAASSNANLTASDMSKGSGLGNSGTDYDGGFNAYHWSTTNAINPIDYYEFTVTPSAGFEMDLTSLVFDETQNDTDTDLGNYFWTVRSSLDNYASDITPPTSVNQVDTDGDNSGTTSTNNTVTLPGAFLNITTAITFRLYAYDVFTTNMDWGIDNVVLNGAIVDIIAPKIQSAAFDNVTTITVTFDENVQITANTPSDFTVTDGQGTAFTVTGLADNVASDDNVVLTVNDMTSAVGDMKVTYTNGTNEIEDFGGNSLATDATGVIIDTDSSVPGLLSATFDNVTTITVTFDEDVKITANTPGDFTVVDGQGTAFTVTGLADNVANDEKVVLTVNDMSVAVGDMKVTYSDGANEIEDFGGNALATDATGVTIDTDSSVPGLLSAAFDNITTITVTFDEVVKITANTPADFTVTDGQGTAFTVTGLADNIANDDKVVLTVNTMSAAVGDMKVTYNNGTNEIEDFGGNSLATDATGVTINTDTSAPNLLSATKDNNTTLTITFDEDVKITSNTPGDFTVVDALATGFTVTGLADNVANDDELVLTVNNLSTAVGDLTITYTDGTNEIEDFGGNILATDGTGVVIADNTSPLADITYDDLDGFVKTGQTIRITATFNEPIAGAPVMQVSLTGATNNVALTDMTFSSSTVYYYDHIVVAGNGSVTVALGTGTDVEINIVTSIPNSGATFNVDNNQPQANVTVDSDPIFTGDLIQNVTVTYDDNMDQTTTPLINVSGSAHFTAPAGAWISATEYRRTYTHNGTAEEIAAATFTVTAASGATDLAGNADLADASIPTFVIDTQRPTITYAGLTIFSSSAEYVEVLFSEPINLSNGVSVDYVDDGGSVGFDVIGADDNAMGSADYVLGTNTVDIFSAGNSSKWDITTSTLTYTSGGNIFDQNGNEMANAESEVLANGNTTPPTLSPNIMTLYPDGENKDQIVFTTDLELNLTESEAVTGFSSVTHPGTIGSAIYSGKGTTNTITLTSVGNYDWTNAGPSITITYTNGGGNVLNTGLVEMATITNHVVVYEAIAPTITTMTIASDNANTDWAKDGDKITVTLVADDGLDYSSIAFTNVRSGGVLLTTPNITVSPNTDVHNYTATFDILAADTYGTFTFTLNYTDEAGNVGGTLTNTNITVGSQVIIDNIDPGTPSAPNLVTADDSFSPSANEGTNDDNITNVTLPRFKDTGTDPEDNSTVNVYSSLHGAGLTSLGTGTADGFGDFEFALVTPLIEGTHSITITATDAAGNEGPHSAGLTVKIDVTPPSIDYIELDISHTHHDHMRVFFTEELDLVHNTAHPNGFSTSPVTTFNNSETKYKEDAPDYYMYLTSNGNVWNSGTTVSYSGGDLYDIAGNTFTAANVPSTDNNVPEFASGLRFLPNGTSPEQIIFIMSEELINAAGTGTISGFSVDQGVLATVAYSDKGVSNTITLTSTSDGDWDQDVLLSYTPGNLQDLVSQSMVPTPNEEILLKNIIIRSNNSTNPTTHAKEGDKIFLDFTTTSALVNAPVVTIDGVSASVSGGSSAPNYIYEITTTSGTTQAAFTFSIDVEESDDNDQTTITETTTGTSIIFDKTAPVVTPRIIGSNNAVAPAVYARDGNTITLSFTSNEVLNTPPTVTIDGLSPTLSAGPLAFTATQVVSSSNTTTGTPAPISITMVDLAGNTTVHTTTTNASSTIIDRTPPTVQSIDINGTTPNVWSTTNGVIKTAAQLDLAFLVTFSAEAEEMTGMDATDYKVISDGSITFTAPVIITGTGNTRTVTVNNILGTGKLRIEFDDDNSVKDGANNPVGGDVVGDGDFATTFTGNDYYTIVLPEPTNHITANAVSNQLTSSLTVNWTEIAGGDLPTHYLVILKKSASTFPATVQDGSPNGIPFIANDIDINDDGIAWLNVAVGNSSVTFNNLPSGSNYDFRIYPYALSSNNTSDNIDFKNNATVPNGSGSTTTAAVSTLSFTSTIATISSLTTELTGAVPPQLDAAPNFQFTIKDDGINEGDDITDLTISSIIITAGIGNGVTDDWTTVIAGAELSAYDADDVTTDTHLGVINTANITFSSLNNNNDDIGQIDDNESKTYILKIWLQSPLPSGIDTKDFVFEVDANGGGVTISNPATSSQFAAAQIANSADDSNKISVIATDLAWSNLPATAVGVGAPFTSAPVVTAIDVNGNRDHNYALAVTSLTNTGTIGMNNNPDATGLGLSFATGIYTFDISALTGFSYQGVGDGTLIMTSGTLNSSPASNVITVSYSDNTTITAGVAVEPLTISSLYNELGTPADYVFDIDITDDATGVTVNDNISTRINQIIFNAASLGGLELATNWDDVVANAMLYDGGSKTHAISTDGLGIIVVNSTGGSIGTNTLTFSSIPNIIATDLGNINDGTAKNLRLYIWLKTSVTGGLDNSIDTRHFNFDIEGADITVEAASSTLNLASPSVISGIGNNVIEVTATQLVFEQQPPATANALVNVSPVPKVQANDPNGNLDLDFVEAIVSITNARVTPAEIPMANLPTGAFALGELTFPANFQYTEPSFAIGDGQLTVKTASFSITSDPVDVVVSELSDIIEDASYSYPTNFDYLPYDVETDLLQIAQYTLTDGGDGNGNDDDNADTELTSLTLNFANFSSIRQVAIYEGSTLRSDVKTLDVSGNVTFDDTDILPFSISASDNGTTSLNVRVNFNTNVVDNEQFTVEITGVGQNLLKSRFADPVAAGGAITTLGADDNKVEVTATAVEFTSQPHPTNVSTFTNIDNPYIVVKTQDVNLNTDLDYNGTFDAITNNFGPILLTQNDPTGNFTNGVYDFQVKAPSFQFTTDGLGGQLIISASGLPDGTSALFDVSASQESYISYVSDGGKIPYVSFPPTADLVEANSYAIAEFMLHDGNPALYGNDIDGASTVISSITISLTNFINLDKLGIFDASGTQYGTDQTAAGTVVFTSVNFSATDNGTNNFYIKASFKDNNSDITDEAVIDVAITNVVGGGGSKFEDILNNTGGEPDGGGGFDTAITPVGNNKIDVVASVFVFTQQPSPIEGINVVWATNPLNPTIESRDANGNLDTQYVANYTLSSPVAGLDQGTVPPFTNGVLDLTNLTFTSTGVGTLTIEDSTFPIATQSTNSSGVEVIHTDITQLLDGMQDSSNPLVSGQGNVFVYGFGLEAFNDTGAEPNLNEITLRFKNLNGNGFDINSIFKNFRLFRSLDNSIDPSLANTSNVGLGVISAVDAVTFSGLSEFIDDQSGNPNLEQQYFFIIVDISVDADEATPHLVPYLASSDLIVSSGSALITGTITENEYEFSDPRKPEIDKDNLIPSDDNITVDVNTTFVVAFDESVVSMDEVITLRIQGVDKATFSPSLEIASVNPYSVDRTKVTFEYVEYVDHDSNPVTPDLRVLKSLDPETNYYITIAEGDKTNLTGFKDESTNENVYDGHSSNTFWNFRTADITPPIMSSITIDLDNIDDQGFSFELELDEKGRVYYLIVDPTVGGFNAPTGTEVFTQDNTVSGFLAMGTFDILLPNQQHVLFINGLSSNQSFQVYAMAEDIGLVRMLDGDIGSSSTETTLGSSTAGVVVITPELPICEGDIQPQISPLVIKEGENGDFTNGSHSMLLGINSDDFVFEKDVLPNFSSSSSNLSNFAISYLSSSIVQITYDVSGTAGQRDYIHISGFRFKSINGGATASVIKLAGDGSSDFIPNDIELIKLIGYNSIANAVFSFDPDVTSIGNLQSPLIIEPDPSLILGTNAFSGNGVFYDASLDKFKFNPGTAGNSTHTITLAHTDVNKCIAEGFKNITVFDENNSITDLEDKYCIAGSSGNFSTLEVKISATSQEGFRLDTLWLNTDDLAGSIEGSFKANIDPLSGVLVEDGNDYLFYPNIAAIDSVNQSSVALQFVGRYVNIFNVADTIQLKKVVSISDNPTITSFVSSTGVFSGNTIDYCENDAVINLTGSIDRTIHLNTADTISMVNYVAPNFITIDDLGSLDDNNAGVGTVNPQEVTDFFGSGSYMYQYFITNTTTTCASADTLLVNINPKPIAAFSITGKAKLDGCVDEAIIFLNESDIITNSTYEWSFNDEKSTEGNLNTASDEAPSHSFSEAANYNVSLITTTDKKCVSEIETNDISIGNNPITSFNFQQITTDSPTIFTNTTPTDTPNTPAGTGISTNVDTLKWYIGEVLEKTVSDDNSDPELINPYNDYTFDSDGRQKVVLTAITDKNCAVSDTLNFFTVPKRILNSSDANTANDSRKDEFSQGAIDQEGWVAWDENNSSSWAIGSSGGDVIIDGTDFSWNTGVGVPHNVNEVSFVYSPVYNIADLDLPLLNLSKFADLQTSNGVVIEYTAEDLRGTSQGGIDSTKWKVLGTDETGLNWYSEDAIDNVGGIQPTKRYGWTGTDAEWMESKHSLSEAKAESLENGGKGEIQFRISFVSGNVNASFDGFAFDNVYVGSRNRVVLVENFTSSRQNSVNSMIGGSGSSVKQENDSIFKLADTDPSLMAIQYHPDIEGRDPIGKTPDANARALYYGLGTTPRVAIDGTVETEMLFSEWGKNRYDIRSLDISPINIETNFLIKGRSIEIISSIATTESIPKDYVVHTVIVQNTVSATSVNGDIISGESEFNYVVRKMLPSASGVKIKEPLNDSSLDLDPVYWSPSNEFNANDITIIVFVQDESTREIYQARVTPLNENIITSLSEELSLKGFAAWPNPANDLITLEVSQAVRKDTKVTVYDQLGQILLTTKLNAGECKIKFNSQDWTPGIYYIQTEFNGEPIQKRILVQHK